MSDLMSMRSKKRKIKNQDSFHMSNLDPKDIIIRENDMDVVSMVSEIDSRFENSMLSFMEFKNKELVDEIDKHNTKSESL